MALWISRGLLLVMVALLLPVAVVTGLIAGPIIGVAWIVEDAKRTLRLL